MKVFIAFIFSIICSSYFAQQWQWAKGIGALSRRNFVTVDSAGNIYVAGDFESVSVTFDSITLISQGCYDMFLAKYDNLGNVIWAKSAGGTGCEVASSIVIDSLGNLLMAGNFDSPTISFDTITLGNNSSGWNPTDLFLAKYDNNGSLIWAKSFGGDHGEGWRLTGPDSYGNILLAGSYWSRKICLDTICFYNSDTSGTTRDFFIAKFDSNGNILWAKSAGQKSYSPSYSYDDANSVFIDDNDNILLTGSNGNSITLDTFTILGDGMFIVKYNSGGDVIWAKSVGCSGGSFVTADGDNNIIAAGTTCTIFYPPNCPNCILDGNMMLIKYDELGNILWAKAISGNWIDLITSITTDNANNILITGYFGSNIIALDSTTLNGQNGTMFIAKYNKNGNLLWVKQAGGGYFDQANSLTIDSSGDEIVSGTCYSSITIFGNDTLENSDYGSMFLAKLSDVSLGFLPPKEFIFEKACMIYPNPSSGIFTIDITQSEGVNLSVYNMLGKCLMRKKYYKNSINQIDLNLYPKGIYFLEFSSENQVAYQRIVVQ